MHEARAEVDQSIRSKSKVIPANLLGTIGIPPCASTAKFDAFRQPPGKEKSRAGEERSTA